MVRAGADEEIRSMAAAESGATSSPAPVTLEVAAQDITAMGKECLFKRGVVSLVGVKIRPCRDLELLGFVLLFYLVPSAEELLGPRDTDLPYAPTTHTDLQQPFHSKILIEILMEILVI